MDIKTRPDPIARARELGAEIAAAADEIERTRRVPEALLGRLHDSRLFRMLLPRSAGGDETEPALYMAAVEAEFLCRVHRRPHHQSRSRTLHGQAHGCQDHRGEIKSRVNDLASRGNYASDPGSGTPNLARRG